LPFGRIEAINYYKGKFFSANLDKASSDNERNTIQIHTDDGASIRAVHIAGLIARRIACWIKIRDIVKKGVYVLPNLFTTASLFAGF
jgi:phosphatidylserine decarboxylase